MFFSGIGMEWEAPTQVWCQCVNIPHILLNSVPGLIMSCVGLSLNLSVICHVFLKKSNDYTEKRLSGSFTTSTKWSTPKSGSFLHVPCLVTMSQWNSRRENTAWEILSSLLSQSFPVFIGPWKWSESGHMTRPSQWLVVSWEMCEGLGETGER